MEKEQDVHPEHQRKTLSLTHKQAFGIGAALLLVQPLFDMFMTKDVSNAKMEVIQVQMDGQKEELKKSYDSLKEQIETVDNSVKAARTEVLSAIKDFSVAQRERDLEAYSRQKEVDDKQDRRVELLEANQIYGRKPASKN